VGQIRSAYQRFWQIAQHVDQQPPGQWRTLLGVVVAEPLLTRLIDGLQVRIRAGYRQYGDVIPHVRVIEVRGGRASVLDCQDASRAGEVDLATGLPTNLGRARTPIAATLIQGSERRWRVSDARYLDEDC
jgi:hypothetical protein